VALSSDEVAELYDRQLTDIEYERIEDLAGSRELRDHVAEELESLPHDQREAVRLRVVEEQGYQTLSKALDISQDTARARVSRGLQALRVAIDAVTAESSLQRSADHA
jgi:RNA polymerase sigma factor (sigma-70 family)